VVVMITTVAAETIVDVMMIAGVVVMTMTVEVETIVAVMIIGIVTTADAIITTNLRSAS
jgi:hypothetical protein